MSEHGGARSRALSPLCTCGSFLPRVNFCTPHSARRASKLNATPAPRLAVAGKKNFRSAMPFALLLEATKLLDVWAARSAASGAADAWAVRVEALLHHAVEKLGAALIAVRIKSDSPQATVLKMRGNAAAAVRRALACLASSRHGGSAGAEVFVQQPMDLDGSPPPPSRTLKSPNTMLRYCAVPSRGSSGNCDRTRTRHRHETQHGRVHGLVHSSPESLSRA